MKITWIVMKNDKEVSRHVRKATAECVAMEIGGIVVRYVKE